jgi:hypothetical protein
MTGRTTARPPTNPATARATATERVPACQLPTGRDALPLPEPNPISPRRAPAPLGPAPIRAANQQPYLPRTPSPPLQPNAIDAPGPRMLQVSYSLPVGLIIGAAYPILNVRHQWRAGLGGPKQ